MEFTPARGYPKVLLVLITKYIVCKTTIMLDTVNCFMSTLLILSEEERKEDQFCKAANTGNPLCDCIYTVIDNKYNFKSISNIHIIL